MDKNNFPPGWDQEKIEELIAYHEARTDEEAMAEDEAVFGDPPMAVMEIPWALVPTVRELLAQYRNEQKVHA